MPAERLTGEKLLKRIKACFKAVSDVESSQRAREKEDLEFQIPENQWDSAAKEYRKGTPTTPGRPMLSVSLLSQPMALIQNQAVSAKLGVEIHPVSEQADPEVAEIKQGLYRRIERDSNAQEARLWALDRAKQAGRGWYRVNTQWDEDGDDPFDQEIQIERILYQDSVYMDPSAQKSDFSDANWCVIATWVPVQQFERDYPGKDLPKNDTEFKAWETEDPDWVTAGGERQAVLVVEYWWKEKAKGETVERKTDKLKRQKERTIVRWALATAKEVLEEEEWMGQYIPIVGVLGIELQPFDGQRYYEGMVRKARDAQKYFNMAISSEVEGMALEPKVPWVGAEGQFRGHEDEWLLSNVRNQPTLEYVPTSHLGNLNPPPQRAQVDTSRMMLAHQASQSARELIHMATNVYAPSLGDMPSDQSKQSGRAILALQQQSDAGTSHFLQNLARAMQYEARIVLDLLPKVYDRPGRIVQVLGEEDDPRFVMLNAPHVQSPEGRPTPIPPGMPPPPDTKVFDLTRGKFTVSVNIGKSFQTRLQEGAQEIGQVLQSAPALMPLLGATYFRFRDFPGAKEIADILKKVRDKQLPGLDDDGKQPTVEQLKAQMEQMGQQGQQMQQQLQMAMQKLETDQAKQQATMAKAQLDNQTAMAKAQLDAQTKIQVAEINADWNLAVKGVEARIELIGQQVKLISDAIAGQHEQRMAQEDRLHEHVQGQLGRQHEAVQGAVGRQHEAQQATAGRQHESAEGFAGRQHEAVMTELNRPEPESPAEDATEKGEE